MIELSHGHRIGMRKGRNQIENADTEVLRPQAENSQAIRRIKGHRHENHSFDAYYSISISYGCVLVPIILVVWWYWVKKSTQEVLSRVGVADLGVEPHENVTGMSEDEYSCW